MRICTESESKQYAAYRSRSGTLFGYGCSLFSGVWGIGDLNIRLSMGEIQS